MMAGLPPPLSRSGGELSVGGVSCVELAATYGTPLFVIDETRIRDNYRRLRTAFSRRWSRFGIHYAIKANNSLSVLRILQQEGAGVDCSCLEEVELARIAGFSVEDMLLTANYVSFDDLRKAFGMGLLVNLDEPSVLRTLSADEAPDRICMRINPGFGRGAFPTLVLAGNESKFGMNELEAVSAFERAKALGVRRFGLHMMAGSCVLDPEYFGEVTRRLLRVAGRIMEEVGIEFEFINVGGGFGVPYAPSEEALDIDLAADRICSALSGFFGSSETAPRLLIEPGRYVVCDSTVLLSRVRAVKEATEVPFVGIDAGMNTLLRPALYGAYHEVLLANRTERSSRTTNLCGTICENTDVMARRRTLPVMVPGDLVAIMNAGAYGFSMSSQYNTRPKAAEVLVANGGHELIRERESLADIVSRQRLPRRLEA